MIALLMAFWLILNGRADWDVLITGALATAVIMLAARRAGGWTLGKEFTAIRLIPRACVCAGALIIEIIKANISVMRLVLTGRAQPYIRSFQTRLKTGYARVMLANAITLTPGTATIQLSGDRLTVHCLCREMAEGLTDSRMERLLMELEAKALAKRV